VKWDTVGIQRDLCCCAAEHGHLDIVQWCQNERYHWDESTCTHAADHGQIWMWTFGCSPMVPSQWMCTTAARFNQVETLEWCIENNCPYHAQSLEEYGFHVKLLLGRIESR
jgi:hypothetical protein